MVKQNETKCIFKECFQKAKADKKDKNTKAWINLNSKKKYIF